MSIIVDITGITGTTPFNIYICDSGFTSCFYVTSINTPTGSFTVPSPYDGLPSFGVKIIDGTTCSKTEIINNPTP
jgi:hypothetical protein